MRQLRETTTVLILCTWSLLLIGAALPPQFERLLPVRTWAEAALRSVDVFAGLPVFSGASDTPWTHYKECVTMIGTLNGSKHVTWTNADRCAQSTGIRPFADPTEVAILRLVDASMAAGETDRGRGILRGLTAPACRSGASTVAIIEQSLMRERGTDREQQRVFVAAYWDCRLNREVDQPWPPLRELLP